MAEFQFGICMFWQQKPHQKSQKRTVVVVVVDNNKLTYKIHPLHGPIHIGTFYFIFGFVTSENGHTCIQRS